MSLRQKTLLIIGVALAALISVFAVSGRLIYLRGMENLGRRKMDRNVWRAENMISRQTERIARIARIWASRQMLDAFMTHQSPDYIRDNLTDGTFADLHLNFVLLIDPSGRVVFSRLIGPSGKKDVPLSGTSQRAGAAFARLIRAAASKAPISGISRLSGRPVLFAARPIPDPHRKGRVDGVLIVGRFLDKRYIASVAKTTGLSILMYDARASILPPVVRSAVAADLSGAGNAAPVIRPVNDNTLLGYAAINDIDNNPAVVLKIRSVRDIYHHGETDFWYFMLAVVGSGLVFGILTLWFLERQVISRLSRLSGSVLKIAQSDGFSERIELPGNDELNRLAENINAMLAAKQETEAHYRILFQESKDAAYFTDRDGRVMICNQAAIDMFGYDKTEMLELNAADVYEDPKERIRLVRELVSAGSVEDYEIRFRRKDGTKVTGRISASVRWADDGKLIGFQGVIRDVTQLKHRVERLVYMATHDSLTDLPNRYLLNDRLDQAIFRARRNGWTLGVLWLDLDHFKDINDTLGHDMGDKVLQGFCARLISILRASDTVARIGGDEFVILLPEITNLNDGEVVAKKVIDAIRKPFRADGHELFLTISIGIAVFPKDGSTADALLQHADMAMYQAKGKGRDNYARFEAQQMPSGSV